MSDVPMPRDLSEEAVAEWLWAVSSIEGDPAWDDANSPSKEQAFAAARAVLALVSSKVRKAVRFCSYDDETDAHINDIVARVMGKEAPK